MWVRDNEIIGDSTQTYLVVGKTDVNSFGWFRWLREWFSPDTMISGRLMPIVHVQTLYLADSFDPVSLNIVTARINWPRWFSAPCEIIKGGWIYRDRSADAIRTRWISRRYYKPLATYTHQPRGRWEMFLFFFPFFFGAWKYRWNLKGGWNATISFET